MATKIRIYDTGQVYEIEIPDNDPRPLWKILEDAKEQSLTQCKQETLIQN